MALVIGALLSGVLAWGLQVARPREAPPRPLPAHGKKLIVLGFDGADPKLCARWMDELDPATGKPYLEHLDALRKRGSFKPLATTVPAQTPVAWAGAACSANPGVTSIADFVGRDPATMRPYLTLAREESQPFGWPAPWRWAAAWLAGLLTVPAWLSVLRALRLRAARARGLAAGLIASCLACGAGWMLTHGVPFEVPRARNLREGTTLWKVAADAGVRTTMLRFPLTFPAEDAPNLRMLSGFGVPDLHKTQYSWTLFDSAAKEAGTTETYGTLQPWSAAGGVYRGSLPGPTNPLPQGELAALEVTFEAESKRLRIGAAAAQEMSAGVWSEPFLVEFRFSPVARLGAQIRAVWLPDPGDPARVRVLVGPAMFDPARVPPHVPLSYPHDYAAELAAATGTFPTAGWAIATHPAKDGVLPDAAFLDDLNAVLDAHEALFARELQQDRWDLLMAVFMATDRAGHILWRHLSPDHPLHDPAHAAAGIAALREVYRRMDRIVGQALARAEELDAEVLVVSDHGFAAFDTQVHLNAVLREAGLLATRAESLPADARQVTSGENLNRIDFTRTQAYALGLGGIYLNLKGRERWGVVQESERELVTQLVIDTLLKLRDPKAGKAIVRRVLRAEDLYRGPHAAQLPDLQICFEPGYRVSWSTVVGGAPASVMEPNRSAWSGDHCSIDPDAVPGVLFSTRPWKEGNPEPKLLDLAPSALGILGHRVPEGTGWEGRAWWEAPP
ncbi:MAG: alkaline phosphatase family protein [Planctomycetes bacterium]|nr:alkaline phosphatase family protein [Planctomycetota bacterium]